MEQISIRLCHLRGEKETRWNPLAIVSHALFAFSLSFILRVFCPSRLAAHILELLNSTKIFTVALAFHSHLFALPRSISLLFWGVCTFIGLPQSVAAIPYWMYFCGNDDDDEIIFLFEYTNFLPTTNNNNKDASYTWYWIGLDIELRWVFELVGKRVYRIAKLCSFGYDFMTISKKSFSQPTPFQLFLCFHQTVLNFINFFKFCLFVYFTFPFQLRSNIFHRISSLIWFY